MNAKQRTLFLLGIAICGATIYAFWHLIAGSKFGLAIIGVLIAVGVAGYLYSFERENWKQKFLEFMFLEVVVAGLLYEAWFAP